MEGLNLAIVSEMRTGSRWLHYLLADILQMMPSPEIGYPLGNENLNTIDEHLANNRIVKFHQFPPKTLLDLNKFNKIIGIVRCPRDRAVSLAFHHRYHLPLSTYPEWKERVDDFDAVKYTVTDNYRYIQEEERQKLLSPNGFSTFDPILKDNSYIWTSYEWMKEDSFKEIQSLLYFLDIDIDPGIIKKSIQKNSFESKSGRKEGKESRRDTWRRKGIIGDWVNWFNNDMVKITEEYYTEYWNKINSYGDFRNTN